MNGAQKRLTGRAVNAASRMRFTTPFSARLR